MTSVMSPTRLSLLAGSAVLAIAVALQLVEVRDMKGGERGGGRVAGELAAALPVALPRWRVHDEPLGPTEFVQDAVARNLNYDDYVHRIYQREGTAFSVYVGFWKAGRMPVSKIASHTPDRCWSSTGWECTAMRFNVREPVGETLLPPAQWRVFVQPDDRDSPRYVLYWHLVGDELYDYGERFNARPHPLKWWRDTLKYAIQGSREQYFIRLTSNRAFEEIWDDPGVQELVDALARLGLAQANPPLDNAGET